MRTIIAGSRSITNYKLVEQAVMAAPWIVTTVISGGAKGVDSLGERYAREYDLPLEIFPADWKTHGRAAGYKRNVEMAEQAQAVIVVWDGSSRGTGHMMDIAREKGLRIFVSTHTTCNQLQKETYGTYDR